MNMPMFTIDKTISYQSGKRGFEAYAIQMNGSTICIVHREKAEELLKQLDLALNDRKEGEHDEKE